MVNRKSQNTIRGIGFNVLCCALGTILLLGSLAAAAQKKMPVFSAAVQMSDGNIYELTDVEFIKAEAGSSHYTLYPGLNMDKLRMKLPPEHPYLVIDIPVADIKEIVVEPDHMTIRVVLQDGQNLKGSWGYGGWTGDGYLIAFQGRTQGEGYPGKVEIPRFKISRIDFVKGGDGTIAAQVTTTDGKVKQNLTKPEFHIDQGDSRGGVYKTDKLNFNKGDTTLEIPTEQIISIDRRHKPHLLTLNNGKSLSGNAYFALVGNTQVYGHRARFRGSSGIVYLTFKDGADLQRALQEGKPQEKPAQPETGKGPGTATPPTSSKDAPLASKTIQLPTPKDLLPHFQTELKGANEVRVNNPNDSSVQVGLRQGNRGKNFTVPARGVVSVRIPNGKYDIYFVYSDKPEALFQGDSFSLNNNGVEIRLVKVVGGNYGIKRVK